MLNTEKRNEKTTHIDKMSTMEMIKVMQEENYNALRAIDDALPMIERAVDAAAHAVNNGGRIIYLGAGTSGRLGVLDAVECPPTFGVSPELVVGIIAGGKERMFTAAENAEDIAENGIRDLKEKNITDKDLIVGISAAGNAAYIVGALEYAKSLGCVTVGITSNKDTLLDKTADISVVTDTGAEVITGSTRLKAGTSQKLILNMISTCAMIKMGNVYENLMINLKAVNIKLIARMISIVSDILGISREEAEAELVKSDWVIRRAVENYKAE